MSYFACPKNLGTNPIFRRIILYIPYGDVTGFDGNDEVLIAYRVPPADTLNGWNHKYR